MADLPPDLSVQPGQTLMEFTGSPNAGTARINSRSVRDPDTGRLARYEFGGGVRFLAVWDADVGFLESIGDFRRAGAAAAPEVPAVPMQVQVSAAPPVAAPEAADAVLGASEAVPVSAADLEAGMQQALAEAERLSAQKAEQAAQTVRRRGRK